MAKLLKAQREAISAYAEICDVQHGLAGFSSCPELDQITHRIGKQSPWKDYLDERDLLRVVFWHLFNTTSVLLPPGYSGLLKKAPHGAKMMEDFQNGLVKYLESLPRTYNAYFPLVGVPETLTAELKLTDSVAIIDTTRDANHPLVEGSESGRLRGVTRWPQPRLKQGARYLRVTVSGYTDGSTSSPASFQALAQLKHFLFFGLATGLLDVELQ